LPFFIDVIVPISIQTREWQDENVGLGKFDLKPPSA